MRSTVPTLAALTMAALLASGQSNHPATQTKAPWGWTLDERLAARHDPAAAAERVRAAKRDGHISMVSAQSMAQSSSEDADYISGREHPELLLPWQVFDTLIRMAYADDPKVRSIYRETKAPSVASANLPSDFWDRLLAVSLAYLSDQSQLRDLHRTRVSDPDVKHRIEVTTAGLQQLECRDRAMAIAAARREFGAKFDRFLYEGVAPSMVVSITRAGQYSVAQDRAVEEGCR